jgi:hypothetical protein
MTWIIIGVAIMFSFAVERIASKLDEINETLRRIQQFCDNTDEAYSIEERAKRMAEYERDAM